MCANWNSTCVFSLHKLSSDCPFGAEGLSWHVPVGGSDQFVIPSPLCVLPALRWWPCSDPGGTLGQGQVFHTHHTGTKDLVPADPCLRGRGTEDQAFQNFSSLQVKRSVTRIPYVWQDTALSEWSSGCNVVWISAWKC